jgi:hypothetical protein
MKIWTRLEAMKLLCECNGGFKAGTCREDDGWYRKHNCLDLREYILKQTSFLDNEIVTFHERMLYFKLDLHTKNLCKICLINKTNIIFGTATFCNVCSSIQCKSTWRSMQSKLIHQNLSDEQKRAKNQKISNSNKGTLDEKFSKEKADLIRKHQSEAQTGKKQSQEQQNKRIATRRKNNPVWHTQETKDQISITNKITAANEEFKKKHAEICAKSSIKISNTMKLKIQNGEFTPNITNSWTHFTAYIVQNKQTHKFRSSWEAVYWYLNQHLLYEKIRILYTVNNEQHNFIVDFYDEQNKLIIEIKPKSNMKLQREEAKFQAAFQWAKEHNHTFIIINDDWFKSHSNEIKKCLFDQPHLTPCMKQFLC